MESDKTSYGVRDVIPNVYHLNWVGEKEKQGKEEKTRFQERIPKQ
jgi:hypothetical protein